MKVTCFTMTEALSERLVNDDDLENERETIKGIDWGYVGQDFDMRSVAVAGEDGARIRRALQAVDPTATGWREHDLTSNYRFFHTNAPESYDGMGTMTAEKISETGRVVAIETRHVDWQTMRYRSGLFAATSFQG